MNKTLIATLLFSIILTSCNDTKKKENTTETIAVEETHKEVKTDTKSNTLNNNWITNIKLDGNVKWDANIETTQGVNKMKKSIAEANLKTVEDYHALASLLNNEKNFVIKECTMKGPSHDNLHIFLLPLIDKISLLVETTSIQEGSEITESIIDNLNAYENYFQ
jgi:hypothetical protein